VLDLLAFPVFSRALIALVATGVAFPALGTIILNLELVPARFAVMHASLLGAAVGLLVGIDPMVAAIAAALLAGFGVARMSERGSVSAGGSLGLVMTLTLGLAFVVLYKGKIHAIEAFSLFWGNVLALTPVETALTAATAMVVIVVVALFFKEIQAVLYDRVLAAALGIRARPVYTGLIVLTCLGVGLAMRVTGALMVDAVTILPALAARAVDGRLRPSLLWGAAFGLAMNLGGFALAFALDLPVSPAIIITGTALVFAARLARRPVRPVRV
jgi:zinc transport system permease protein